MVSGFGKDDLVLIKSPHTDALVIKAEIGGYNVKRVFVDTGSSMNIVY